MAYELNAATANHFGPRALAANGTGAFTLYLLEGLELVANAACQGGMTTRADKGDAPVNYGQPAPNNDCVTTAAELFHYASQRTAYLVGDSDDNDGKPDDDNMAGNPDLPKDADGDDGTWPVAVMAAEGAAGTPPCRNVVDDDNDGKLNDGCGDRVAEDPPDFVTSIGAILGSDDDIANDGTAMPDTRNDEDGLGTSVESTRGAFEHSMGSTPPNPVPYECEDAPDLCRQYPKLIDIETDPCQGGVPTVEGTEGDDKLEGTPGDDLIYAKGGNDRIDARQGGNDIVCAGGGDDKVKTGSGADYVDLGEGSDKLRDNGGSNVIRAGDGNNKIILKGEPVGDDNITAGSGNDKIVDKGGGHNTIATEEGDDKVKIKGEGDDIIALGPGDDKAKSGGGDDQIAGDSGSDKCDGGDGTDEAADCETVKHVP
jgi:Ca2+-binding RTX toxin-like protein